MIVSNVLMDITSVIIFKFVDQTYACSACPSKCQVKMQMNVNCVSLNKFKISKGIAQNEPINANVGNEQYSNA